MFEQKCRFGPLAPPIGAGSIGKLFLPPCHTQLRRLLVYRATGQLLAARERLAIEARLLDVQVHLYSLVEANATTHSVAS